MGNSIQSSITVQNSDHTKVSALFNEEAQQLFITALAVGEATISLIDANGITSSPVLVTVSAKDLSLSLSSEMETILVRQIITLDIYKGNDIGALTVSSSNESIATATLDDRTVIIKGQEPGEAIITVTDPISHLSTQTSITVNALDKTLSIEQSITLVKISKQIELTITKGANVGTLLLTSTNSNATAVVSGNNLVVTGYNKGSTTFTLTDKDDASTLATVTIQVIDLDLTLKIDGKSVIAMSRMNSDGNPSDPRVLNIKIGEDINRPLRVIIDDDKIINVTITETTVSIQALFQGSTKFHLTDGVKHTDSITVNVHDIYIVIPEENPIVVKEGETKLYTFKVIGADLDEYVWVRTNSFATYLWHTVVNTEIDTDGGYALITHSVRGLKVTPDNNPPTQQFWAGRAGDGSGYTYSLGEIQFKVIPADPE